MLFAVLVCGVLAYANALTAPFVLDDEESIVLNPFVTSLWPLSEAMRAPDQGSFAGRPVASLSLAVSYAAGGLSPAAFRSWNIGILTAEALVLFGLVRRTTRRIGHGIPIQAEWFALSVAILWLLHPLQTEVIGYVTQRTESMMGLCYLLTLYATARAIDEVDQARWKLIAIAACAAGMACKESMVTAPLMALLYDIVFGAGSFKRALRSRSLLYIGLAATWIVLAFLNFGGPRSGSAGFSAGTSVTTYLLNQAVMIVTYLKLSVWPHPLVLDYGRTQPMAFSTALPSLLIVAGLMAAVITAWRNHKPLAYLGTWFFVTLAPSSSLVPIASEVGAERRMHLPLIAILVLMVAGIGAAVNRRRRSDAERKAILLSICVALSVAFALLTLVRNREYHDQVGIWQGVVERRPHGRAHYNLAIALRNAGRNDEALTHYRLALPGEPAAHYALGFEASQAGRFDESASQLREFLRLRPADTAAPKASLLLGEALVRLGRPAQAEEAFRNALQLSPGYADAVGALADLLLAQGRFSEAIASYRAYLAILPDTANAHHSLGLALAASDQEARALPEFERAVALNPSQPQFRMSLGTALASQGRLDAAIVQYREGLRLAPSDDRIRSALAEALASRNR
jgi:Flp pilus assembly protein TadD